MYVMKKMNIINLNTQKSEQYLTCNNFRNKINTLKCKLNTKLILNHSRITILEFNVLVRTINSIHILTLNECYELRDVSAFTSIHTLHLQYCENIKDISMLTSNNTLEINYHLKKIRKIKRSQKTRDVGNLREIKKLTINTDMDGVHLLYKLEELIIYKLHSNPDISVKMKRRIKKLKKINPNVKITIVDEFDITRLMFGLGGMGFSN